MALPVLFGRARRDAAAPLRDWIVASIAARDAFVKAQGGARKVIKTGAATVYVFANGAALRADPKGDGSFRMRLFDSVAECGCGR